jgi:hypothetical protein
MKTVIAPGAVIETATPQEMGEHLSRVLQQQFAERARGLTTFRFDHTDTVAAGAVRLPAPGEQEEGPRNGFIWQLGSIRAWGLGTGDVLSIWRNNANEPRNFLGQVTAATPWITFHKLTFIKGGEKLIVTGSSLTATGDITVNGEGAEAGELDFYKLL